MWIFGNDRAISVVADRDEPMRLLARSRVEGDLQRAFPDAEVFQDPNADYRYRSFVSREVLKTALDAMVDGIDYPNFKDSVPDARRHQAYMGVWGAMADEYGAYGQMRSKDD